MPTYLCHGFRWHRRSIRVYVVVQNIDDAAPEWVIAPASSTAILDSFYTLFDFLPEPPRRRPRDGSSSDEPSASSKSKRKNTNPKSGPLDPPEFAIPPPTVPPEHDDVLHNAWSAVKLLEEYDPTNLDAVSRPYAFVADYVTRIDLSVSVAEEIMRYEERQARLSAEEKAMSMSGNQSDEFGKTKKGGTSSSGKKAGWFEKLRDQLQRGEDIRWYVVVCGDEEREVPEEMKSKERPREGGVLGGKERSQSRSRSQSQSQGHSQGQRSRSRSQSQSQSQRGTPVTAQSEWPAPSYQSGGLSIDPAKGKSGGFRRLFGRKHDDPPER